MAISKTKHIFLVLLYMKGKKVYKICVNILKESKG